MNSHFSNIENELSGSNSVDRLQTFSNCSSSSLPDELIEGAVDLHLHSYPEISLSYKGRLTDDELASAAQNLQMGGFVIKSHVWPTMERAFGLQTRFPNLKILGSLTLNPNVGGLNPWAVESAV
jgi:hypothetical protein